MFSIHNESTIIQCNCLGLKANYEETLLLFKDYEPAAPFSLRNTSKRHIVSIRNYYLSNLFFANNESAAGVVSIFVNKNTSHSQIYLYIQIYKLLQLVLLLASSRYSTYISPGMRLSPKVLDDLDAHVPSLYILLHLFSE